MDRQIEKNEEMLSKYMIRLSEEKLKNITQKVSTEDLRALLQLKEKYKIWLVAEKWRHYLERSPEEVEKTVDFLRERKINVKKPKGAKYITMGVEELERRESVLDEYKVESVDFEEVLKIPCEKMQKVFDTLLECGCKNHGEIFEKLVANKIITHHKNEKDIKELKDRIECLRKGQKLFQDGKLNSYIAEPEEKFLFYVFKTNLPMNYHTEEVKKENITYKKFLGDKNLKALKTTTETVEKKKEVTELLDTFFRATEGDLTYCLNGRLFSKPRVVRNFSKLMEVHKKDYKKKEEQIKMLTAACVYGSIFNGREIHLVNGDIGMKDKGNGREKE